MSKSKLKYLGGAALLLLALMGSLILPQASKAEDDLAALQAEQSELQAQIDQANADLEAFENSQAGLSQQYAWLQERNTEVQSLYAERLHQLNSILEIKKSLNQNLQVAIERFDFKVAQYGQRIEAMYRMQQKSLLELLLESDSLEGFLASNRLMKIISDEDEEILQDLRASRDDLAFQKEETERQAAEMDLAFQAVKTQMEQIQSEMALTDAAYLELDQAMEERLKQINNYSELAEEIQAQIRAEQAKQARQNTFAQAPGQFMSYTGGQFSWPCPSSTEITSGFGWRNFPELGLNDFHTGVDFAASMNAPVYAACSGTVLSTSFQNVGGNTIVINCGPGFDNWYCHLNDFACSPGQVVAAGQLIGYVGTTGMSTGPHLHFQVQVNGSPVDPMQYFY